MGDVRYPNVHQNNNEMRDQGAMEFLKHYQYVSGPIVVVTLVSKALMLYFHWENSQFKSDENRRSRDKLESKADKKKFD